MEINLKSVKTLYPLDKTGYENIVMDVHKKVVEVTRTPQKEGEKSLQDIAKNGIGKDHAK